MKKQILLLTIFSLVLFSSSALACTCAARSFGDEYNQTDLIFTGKVTRFSGTDAQTKTYDFEVMQAWKGKPGEAVTIMTAPSAAACGKSFELNDYYVVFATVEGDSYRATICSRTKLLKDASTDIAALREATGLNVDSNIDVTTIGDTDAGESGEGSEAKENFLTVFWNSIKGFFKKVFSRQKQ